jgi:hypothetical protein
LYAAHAQTQLLSTINVTAKQTSVDEMPTMDLNPQPEESYTDLVDRPLFLKNRKPVAETEQAQVTNVTNTFDWLLSGIYTSRKGLMVLLTRDEAIPQIPNSPTNKPHRKALLGDDIDGWKLTKIDHDKIILMQGAMEKVLLLRKPRAKSETVETTKTVNEPASPPIVSEPISEQPPPEMSPEQPPQPEIIPEPQVDPINETPNE